MAMPQKALATVAEAVVVPILLEAELHHLMGLLREALPQVLVLNPSPSSLVRLLALVVAARLVHKPHLNLHLSQLHKLRYLAEILPEKAQHLAPLTVSRMLTCQHRSTTSTVK